MSIRRYQKDNLKGAASPLSLVPAQVLSETSPSNEPLRFWTRHINPVLIDLEPFARGRHEFNRKNRMDPFNGRPILINELAPALRAVLDYSSEPTVAQFLHSLRAWWRLFDLLEGVASALRIQTVGDLGDIHRQRAIDSGMDRYTFRPFVRIVNLVRRVQGLKLLHWPSPEQKERRRHLPPVHQINQVRLALKRGWFNALDRWERADALLAGSKPANAEDVRLLKNYLRLRAVIQKEQHPRPSSGPIWDGLSPQSFSSQGFNIPEMLRGFYPDATDIRMAFCLCLSTTGFNAAVLLSLDISKPFVEPHPKDPTRYLLWAYKARGNSEQTTEGLYKSQGSAGVIIQTLLQRTQPLRKQLVKDLANLREIDTALRQQGASAKELDRSKAAILKLEQGVRSPWLYVGQGNQAITWLNRETYTSMSSEVGGNTFLSDVIDSINSKEADPTRHITAKLKPGDFRDALAAYAYQMSGGAVLYVMKVLGHKQPTTTQSYLDNTLLNEESDRLYRTFSNALWHEIRVYGRADPTLVAKWSRDGIVTEGERQRLSSYRALKRSRLGIGCKDPTSPPRQIAPNFKPDGVTECPVQRCTLCLENAVLFPDSVDGLCKRLIELRVIQSQMSSIAFLETTFREEYRNTERALEHFNPTDVALLLQKWQARVDSGQHRVIAFDGTEDAL